MSENIYSAPWTEQQVHNLNAWQTSGAVHPFTCPYCRDQYGTQYRDFELIATTSGWICAECDYEQYWCYRTFADTEFNKELFPWITQSNYFL